MPKARNKDTEEAIRSAALRLFLEQGVVGTTYSDIAERSSISRPLVQRYFPKKELLVMHGVDTIRQAAVRTCDETLPQPSNPLARLYLRGQVDVATYFATPGIRRFMLDVFSSRELTQRTIAESFRWTVSETLPGHPRILETDEPDELIVAVGGLYELFWLYLSRGDTPDIPASTIPGTLAFARLYGVEPPSEGLEAYAIAHVELVRLAQQAARLIP